MLRWPVDQDRISIVRNPGRMSISPLVVFIKADAFYPWGAGGNIKSMTTNGK